MPVLIVGLIYSECKDIKAQSPVCGIWSTAIRPCAFVSLRLLYVKPAASAGFTNILFLQNYVHKKLHFSSFSGHFYRRKALPATSRHAPQTGFRPHRTPIRPLRLFQNSNSRRFLSSVFFLKTYRFSAVRPSRGYSGAAFVMQRRPRCNAVRAPLQPREGLTARPAQLRRFTTEQPWFVYDYE